MHAEDSDIDGRWGLDGDGLEQLGLPLWDREFGAKQQSSAVPWGNLPVDFSEHFVDGFPEGHSLDVEIKFLLKCVLASKWFEPDGISRLLLDRFKRLENTQIALDIDHGRLMEIEGGILDKPGSNPFDAHGPFLGC